MLTAMEAPDESALWQMHAWALLRDLGALWEREDSAETLLLSTMAMIRETRRWLAKVAVIEGPFPDDRDLAELHRHLDAVTEAGQAIKVGATDPNLGVAFSRAVLQLVQWLNVWVLLAQPPPSGQLH